MKKTIATISVALLLSGCTVLDSLKLAKFDTNEYGSVVDLSHMHKLSYHFVMKNILIMTL